MRRTVTVGSVVVLLATSLAYGDTPEDTIKYRKAVMSSMAAHAGAIAMIFGGKVDFPDYLLSHAEALAAAGEQTPKLFPTGTDTGKTDALPLIWQEPEKFQKAAETMKVASAQLRDAVRSGDKAAIGKAMKPTFDACKGCHDRYRKEQKM